MIYQPVRFQDLHEPLFLKIESNHGVLPKLSYESMGPPTSNNILSEHWIGLLNSLESTQKKQGQLDGVTLVKRGAINSD